MHTIFIKKIFLLITVLLSIAFSYSQSEYIIKADRADSLRRSDNYKRSIPLYNEVLNTINDSNHLERYKYQIRIGLSYFYLGETEKAYTSYISVIEDTKDDSLNIFRAHAFNNLGLLYDNQGSYKKSIRYYQKAFVIYKGLGNNFMVDLVTMNIGILLKKQGKYNEALEKLLYAIKGFKVRGNMSQLAESYSSMGGIREIFGAIREAKKLYMKSAKIRQEIKDSYGLSSVYNNLGIIYMKTYELDSAEYYYKESIKLIKGKSNRNIGNVYHNLGLVYDYKGEINQSKEYFNKALIAKSEIQDTLEMIITLNKMGFIELNHGGLDKAYNYLHNGRKLLSKNPNDRFLKENFDYWKEYYKKNGNNDSALHYLERSNELMKKISNTQYLKEIALLQESFDAKTRDEEIGILSFDNKNKEQKIQKAHKRINNLSWIVGITAFITLLLIITLYILKLQESKRSLKAKLDGVEQEKKRLSSELHDVTGNQLRSLRSDVNMWVNEEENNTTQSKYSKINLKLKNITDTIVSISHELKLPDFNLSPLTTIIFDRIYDWFENKKYNYSVHINHKEVVNRLNISFGKHIDRFILESLTNIDKHTEATEIKVFTEIEKGFIIFIVSDNGKGKTNTKKGIGHRNMHERASEINGRFTFIPSDNGSKSSLAVPLK